MWGMSVSSCQTSLGKLTLCRANTMHHVGTLYISTRRRPPCPAGLQTTATTVPSDSPLVRLSGTSPARVSHRSAWALSAVHFKPKVRTLNESPGEDRDSPVEGQPALSYMCCQKQWEPKSYKLQTDKVADSCLFLVSSLSSGDTDLTPPPPSRKCNSNPWNAPQGDEEELGAWKHRCTLELCCRKYRNCS